jgi:hypothetical protein
MTREEFAGMRPEISVKLVDKTGEEKDGKTFIREKERFSNQATLLFRKQGQKSQTRGCHSTLVCAALIGGSEVHENIWTVYCTPVAAIGKTALQRSGSTRTSSSRPP